MTNAYRKWILFSAAVLVGILILVMCLSAVYTQSIYGSLKEDAHRYLSEITKQSVASLEEKIKHDIHSLNDISSILSKSELHDINTILAGLQSVAEDNSFSTMTVTLSDGISYATDGSVYDSSKSEFFQNGIIGSSGMTGPVYSADMEWMNQCYAPIIKNGQIWGVLSAEQSTKAFEQVLDLSVFSGAGYAYIADNKGGLLACSDNTVIKPEGNAVLDLADKQADADTLVLQRVQDNMLVGVSGNADYMYDGERRYLQYTALDINGWYLITILPESVIRAKTQVIMNYTYGICAAVIIIFAGGALYVFLMLKKSRREVSKLLYTDAVAKCGNLNALKRDAQHILKRKIQADFALAQFDINKFKYINDVYGYEAGDTALAYISSVLRKEIGEQEAFARVGNDVFVILLCYTTKNALICRIEQIIHSIETLPKYNNKRFDITVNMGVYEIMDKTIDITVMLDCVGAAHKMVKSNRILKYAFYDEKMQNRITNEKEIESEMNDALARKEFEVYYQPKYNVDSYRLSGAEALVRWVHPKKGILSPGEFIPVFEKNGFIINLDLYVFEEVCRHISNWIEQGKPVVPISVNLSRLHIAETDFISEFKAIMRKYNVPPSYIEFEVTETMALENTEKLVSVLESIHALGCSVSMDDFGSGYSSLNMLKELPVDILKIDREFFKLFVQNERSKEIVTAIVALAKNLNIIVVAEGIEEKEQLEFLKKIRCDVVQGYLFAKPLRRVEFEHRLIRRDRGCDI